MSEQGDEVFWRIALRDDILGRLVTNPRAYFASTDTERDWYLRTSLYRPIEDFVVEQVPGPIGRAIADEKARRRRIADEVRQQLAERHRTHPERTRWPTR